MKRKISYLPLFCLWGLLFVTFHVQADNGDILDKKIIKLPKSKGSVYELLGKITDHTGYLFIYDSRVINNEQVAQIKKGEYTIRNAIYEITDNKKLILRLIGNHILIQLPDPIAKPVKDKILKDTIPPLYAIEGTLLDRYTNEPIPFASVGIASNGIGTITNMNGEFRLLVSDTLHNSEVQFSHIGYIPQNLSVITLKGRPNTLSLEPKVISLQEVIVRLVNPQKIIRDMLAERQQNYANQPVYFTSFYREGVEKKKGFVNMTEAVFKIYKTPFAYHPPPDQIKLLKMRRISNIEEQDTFITKMKSGINACLMLDLIKHLPEFLTDEFNYLYNYAHTDITVVDDRIANVITFEQKPEVNDPLYRGELYIDSENNALISARFEIHPKYIRKATNMLVERKSRNLVIAPQQVSYTVSYKPWNGTYYINHIRGDLHFRIKKKNQLFGSTPVHTWFEMVTCRIDTVNVSRFTRNEILQTRTVFSDTNFNYDENFWGDFNVIIPEEKLNEAISKINSKIEETGF